MPWHQIVSVRNRIVHAYFNLEWRILWVTATSDVPDLLAKAIIRAEFSWRDLTGKFGFG